MVKHIIRIIAAALLLPVLALAAPQWKEDTPAMAMLRDFTGKVNEILQEHGEGPINSLFGNFPQVTVMGITGEDDAEIPEGVEITVSMFYDTLATLELRVNDLGRFPVIAASIIKALYGETKSWGDVLHIPEERAKRARENPGDSFEEPVDETNGENPRTYYAYYPNEYHDGVNWIQMTLVFPMAGAWDGDRITLGTERSENENMLPEEEANPDYTGYFSTDDYTHLEVFATATPEPDSAAAEYDFR